MSEIIFRCDSGNSNEIGTGHIVRCINLAEKLISKKIVSKNQILFLTRGDKHFNLGKKILLNRGFNFIAKSNNVLTNNSNSEKNEIIKIATKIVIIDRLKTSKNFVIGIKKRGIKVVTFDDYGEGRKFSNLSICAIFKDIDNYHNLIKGYKYIILSASKYYPKKT